MENAQFRAALCIRLAAVEMPPASTCHYVRANEAEHNVCEKPVDRNGLHAELCAIGPTRQRTHKAIARTLGFCLKRAGAFVDYERVAPHLYNWRPNGTCEEAYMDLWCSWAGSLSNTKIDVTVRSAFADRYKCTHCKVAVAADAGAADKQRRYGPEVWALNFETRGRLGADGLALLNHLASEASCWSVGVQRRMARTWRAKLERALLHAQAEGLLLCMGSNLECINREAKMGHARRIAEGNTFFARAEVGPVAHASASAVPADAGVARASSRAHHESSNAEAARADAEAHRLESPGVMADAPGLRFSLSVGAAQLHVQSATT